MGCEGICNPSNARPTATFVGGHHAYMQYAYQCKHPTPENRFQRLPTNQRVRLSLDQIL